MGTGDSDCEARIRRMLISRSMEYRIVNSLIYRNRMSARAGRCHAQDKQ